MHKKNQATTKQTFIDDEKVTQRLQQLKSRYPEGILVSDVTDSEGRQYVDLVQEGGGVLGIALAGFTFVLEEMGIRFMRLAGTSAGAINSMLLAAVGQKHEAKTEKIVGYLADLNLLDLVDGNSIVKRTLSRLLKNKHYLRNASWIFGGLVGIFVLLLLVNTVYHRVYLSWMIWTLLLVLIILGLLGRYYFLLFRRSKFGLNPGKYFEDWIRKILHENGVDNLQQLYDVAYKKYSLDLHNPEAVLYKISNPADVDLELRDREALNQKEAAEQPLTSDLTLIASDISTQRKIELPGMAGLYWKDNSVHPAAFVRASMSIPLFFEPKTVTIPVEDEGIQKAWAQLKMTAPSEASFVDGGIVSNFPISIFHNLAIRTPRKPVFGLRLKDSDFVANEKPYQSLLGLAGAIFSTVRFNYDKDFLSKYGFYNKYVSEIDVREFNWLNFSMKPDEQLKLFYQGVDAACHFLENFNWLTYKQEREALHDSLTNNPLKNIQPK